MSPQSRRPPVPASRLAPSPFLARAWDPFTELQEPHSRTRELMESAWPGLEAGDGEIEVHNSEVRSSGEAQRSQPHRIEVKDRS